MKLKNQALPDNNIPIVDVDVSLVFESSVDNGLDLWCNARAFVIPRCPRWHIEFQLENVFALKKNKPQRNKKCWRNIHSSFICVFSSGHLLVYQNLPESWSISVWLIKARQLSTHSDPRNCRG